MADFKVEWHGDVASKHAAIAIEKGLRDAAEFLLDEALKLVPIDEGTLANSGSTSVDKDKAAVSFDTPYAIRQHEDTTMRHKNGRHAKYLETPFKANKVKLQEFIAAAIKNGLE